jgi:tetratricopeptide (TPR) repeat protein
MRRLSDRSAGRIARAGLFTAAVAALAACADAEPALTRGDRFWADSNYTSALAEYRLALREDPSDSTLLRVAHAYIETNQFERGKEMYDELLARSPEYADQAAFDYITVARRAFARSDRYELASAVDAALALRPGLPVDEFALPLARYYASSAESDRALDFYERALTDAEPDSVPVILYEIAELQFNQGHCDEAIRFYAAFREREPRGERAEQANWRTGNCAFQLAREARADGRYEDALDYVDTVLELGVPQNQQDDAWFERGEIMLALDRRDDALFAYVRVLELNPAGTGQLVERARQRINQLRFGRERDPVPHGPAHPPAPSS